MTSCTIDWNDISVKKIAELEDSKKSLQAEIQIKDAKITELENQIKTIQTEAKINIPKLSLSWTNIPKYANLLIGKYEWGDSHLINMEQWKILFEIPSGEAKKVTENGTTLTVLVAGIYAPNMFYTYDTEKQEIISKENIDDQKFAELLK